jgi:hypothetical protein
MDESTEKPISKVFELDKMSPVVIYGIISAISLFTIYNTKNNLEKLDDKVSRNVIDIYIWYEVMLIIFGGLMLLCFGQNGEKSLCCIILFIPTILIILKLVIVFISVNGLNKKIPNNMMDIGGGIPINYTIADQSANISNLNAKLSQGVQLPSQLPYGGGSMNPPLNNSQQSLGGSNDMRAPLGGGGLGGDSNFSLF